MSTKTASALPVTSLLLALSIVLVWGFNFIMVKTALAEIPPISLCALRFLLAAFPAVFFIARPKIPLRYLLGYGLLTFALQFTLLFAGMAAGVAPGMAALISQLQVFFAVFLALVFLGQPVTGWQFVGALIAISGIVILFTHQQGDCSLTGFLLILLAAFCWGLGNLISVKLKAVNMFALIVWSSLIASVPLLLVAFAVESPLSMMKPGASLKVTTWLAVAYISYASTYFGYSGWSWLLSRYPFAAITPFALLCPIVALLASALIFNEPLDYWKGLAAILVTAGLLINSLGRRIYQALRRDKTSCPVIAS